MSIAGMSILSRSARRRAGLLASCLLFTSGAVAQDAVTRHQDLRLDNASHIDVELSGDFLVTVKARNAPVRHVLAEIARQCDLDILSHDPLDDVVSVDFDSLPVSMAIGRIMRDHSYMLYAGRPAGYSRDDRQSCTGLLQVFSDESGPDSDRSYSGSEWMLERLRAQLKSDDSRSRQKAVRDLEKLAGQEVIGPLAEALGDDNAKIRVEAVYALSEIGGDDATAALATALADENTGVRAQAAYALGAVGGDSAIPLLERALQDTDRRVRETAISAFTDIGGDRSAEAVAVMLRDADPELRIEAVDALSSIGGDVATRLLAQASQDHDDDVGEAAREAISLLTRQDL